MVGTSNANKFEALASEEESDEEDEQVQDSPLDEHPPNLMDVQIGDGDGESGRAPILKAVIGKDRAAAPAAEDPIDEWLDCPPGLNKGVCRFSKRWF